MYKIKTLLISILAMPLVLLANPYSAFDFQSIEQYLMVQQQHELHQRAKLGNKGNYELNTFLQSYYINGGLNAESIGSVQNNQNIGNQTVIEGDNNKVEQSTKGQSNENTIN